jgi:hypothetical protein
MAETGEKCWGLQNGVHSFAARGQKRHVHLEKAAKIGGRAQKKSILGIPFFLGRGHLCVSH